MFFLKKKAKKNKPVQPEPQTKKQKFLAGLKSFALMGLILLLVRAFVIEPYVIPSGSMIPTLVIGDHVFVNKMAYGWRIPFTHFWLAEFDEPKRGDVVVFIPPQTNQGWFLKGDAYIKRVMAIPGDVILYDKGQIFINDQPISHKKILIDGVDDQNPGLLDYKKEGLDSKDLELVNELPRFADYRDYTIKIEDVFGHKHLIQTLYHQDSDVVKMKVPKDYFFVMGDNRHRSSDSRAWGLVPRRNLTGRATIVWLSWTRANGIRWERIGKKIL